MFDAVGRLVDNGSVCCAFSDLIARKDQNDTKGQADEADADCTANGDPDEGGLNQNQARAVDSSENPLALIWAPTGITPPACSNATFN